MKKSLSISKHHKTISEIAKEKGVSLLFATTQLRKGMKVESEHHKFKYNQRRIALQHLEEKIDFYKKAHYVQDDGLLEKGGGTFNDRELLAKFKRGESIGFTKVAHLKAKGLIARKDGHKRKSEKYMENGGKMESSFEKGGEILSNLLKVGDKVKLRRLPIYYRKGDVGKERESIKVIKKIRFVKEMDVDPLDYNGVSKITEINVVAKDNQSISFSFHDKDLVSAYSDNARYEAIDNPIMEKGGELNPDDPKLKNTMIHKSGSAGGVLVGKRHSEGGIKAVNKSSDSPLEMEGGEVVITRNAVSDDEKREFEGKMMTNRQILSKINEDGGGVAFANGGKIEKERDCGCDDKMEEGGDLNWGEDLGGGFSIGNDVFIIDNKSLYNGKTGYISGTIGKDLLVTISQGGNERNIVVSKKGVEKLDAPEFYDGGDTNSKVYKGFEIGSDGTYKIPNIKNFGIKHHDLPPSEAFKKIYRHTFEDGGEIYKDGGLIQIIDKQVPSMRAFENVFNHLNFHSVKNAYKQHLKKMYNVTFDDLPHRIQMALLLGNQKLVDKFINE